MISVLECVRQQLVMYRCPLIPSAQQIQEVRKSMQYKIKQPDLTQIAAESEYIWKEVIWITLGHFHKITLPS